MIYRDRKVVSVSEVLWGEDGNKSRVIVEPRRSSCSFPAKETWQSFHQAQYPATSCELVHSHESFQKTSRTTKRAAPITSSLTGNACDSRQLGSGKAVILALRARDHTGLRIMGRYWQRVSRVKLDRGFAGASRGEEEATVGVWRMRSLIGHA